MLRIIIFLLAIGSGTLAAWMSVRYLSGQPQVVEIAVEIPQSEILVLGESLPRGSIVSTDDLRWQVLPVEAVPEMAILRDEQPTAPENFVGRVARTDLRKGDALRVESLVDGGAGLMSLILQPGMRAVGVRISEEKTAGGFILPDDKVDILHTLLRDVNGDGQVTGISRTILTNVRVLAIGQVSARSAAKNAETGTAVKPGSDVTAFGETATLELTPEQAEILISAQSSGSLSLSLRAVSDFGETAIGMDVIGTAPAGADRRMAAAAGPAPTVGSVRVIDGGEIRTVSLGN